MDVVGEYLPQGGIAHLWENGQRRRGSQVPNGQAISPLFPVLLELIQGPLIPPASSFWVISGRGDSSAFQVWERELCPYSPEAVMMVISRV